MCHPVTSSANTTQPIPDTPEQATKLEMNNYHICKNGIIREYGSLVCSMCIGSEATNFITSKEEFEKMKLFFKKEQTTKEGWSDEDMIAFSNSIQHPCDVNLKDLEDFKSTMCPVEEKFIWTDELVNEVLHKQWEDPGTLHRYHIKKLKASKQSQQKEEVKGKDWEAEIKKCKDSPYYFATTYLTVNGEPFETRMSEEDFNRVLKNTHDTEQPPPSNTEKIEVIKNAVQFYDEKGMKSFLIFKDDPKFPRYTQQQLEEAEKEAFKLGLNYMNTLTSKNK